MSVEIKRVMGDSFNHLVKSTDHYLIGETTTIINYKLEVAKKH